MTIDRVLKIEGASISWTLKQITKMVDKKTITFDNVVQRGDTWEVWRRSELIWSVIMNYPIPPIYCERGHSPNENVKVYDCLDGRQRCITFHKFLNDEFSLTELKPIYYLDENGTESSIDVSGLKFSELDEELQDIIRDSTITVKYFDNLDQSKKAEMFRRLNAGKPLTAKARTLASAKNIEGLLDIGNHKLFADMLTDKARQSKTQAVIVSKIWTMLNRDVEDISFASKDFNPTIEEMDISDEQREELSTLFDYVVNVHDELVDNHEKNVAKKIYTEVHLVSLTPFVSDAIEREISESMFADFMTAFFKTENNSDEYTEYMSASVSGVASNGAIMSRHAALRKFYDKFFME